MIRKKRGKTSHLNKTIAIFMPSKERYGLEKAFRESMTNDLHLFGFGLPWHSA